MSKILDLFCGAGGAAMGYYQAGFKVVGVDLFPQKNYPFEFVQADALTYPLQGFDAIHASPPCQAFSLVSTYQHVKNQHLNLLPATRKRLQDGNVPYIIENVPNAPIEHLLLLCGTMFNLRVYRHRRFESNLFLFQPEHPKHIARIPHAGNIPAPDQFYCPVGHMGDTQGAQRAMGIDWMKTQHEIAQAIPPAYTKWIGDQLREMLG